MSNQQFATKVIALTGGASGIGLATSHLLASRGATLSIADANGAALDTAKSAIVSAHPDTKVLTTVLDVRDAAAVEAWMAETESAFGRVDGAANLAGVIGRSIGHGTLADQDAAEWDFILGVNLTGVMHCLKAQLNRVTDNGSIVCASSIAGLQGRAKNGAYSASKHGVLGLTRSAAKEVGGRGVRVTAVCPGRIDTPMARNAAQIAGKGDKELGAKHEKSMIDEVALKRSGRAEEVAHLIAFLLSDESTYISGNAISIDGGWNC
ncbi:BcABA4 [Coniochaeta ligniaria NRRL 30616]|uniref:BcABA4 n=1 Tax=Coniochaeta ligniaria NRRL 30616 TaxID=1408157 RepID=A0A1J7IMA6_9PEZI|nr:BcABA4 [Coniochaeta ligniaria NRRL 30616]